MLGDSLFHDNFDLVVQPKSVNEALRHCGGALGARSSDGEPVRAMQREDGARLLKRQTNAAVFAAEAAMQIEKAQMQTRGRNHSDLLSSM